MGEKRLSSINTRRATLDSRLNTIIRENEVHLWIANVRDYCVGKLRDKYSDCLNSAERERELKYHFQLDRDQHFLSKITIRLLLSSYFSEIRPAKWLFSTNEYGKPCVESTDIDFPIEFNLSHSEGVIAIVFTHGNLVGVDVENMRHRLQPIELAERFFSIEEANKLKSLSRKARSDYYYSLWTLKEAYSKAVGLGLQLPLDEAKFNIYRNKSHKVELSETSKISNKERWRFWQNIPIENYKLAVALKCASDQEKITLVENSLKNVLN